MTLLGAGPLTQMERARLVCWMADHGDEVAAPVLSPEERARLRAYAYWRARRGVLWLVLARSRSGRAGY